MSHSASPVSVRMFCAAAALLLALGLAASGAAGAKDKDKEKAKGPGSVTGTVTGVDNKPAVGITVGLYAAPPKAEEGPARVAPAPPKPPAPGAGKAEEKKPAPLKQTTTNARGEFAFASVPPGEYHVTANAKGVRDDRKRVKIKPGEAQRVQLKLEPKEPAAK